MSVGFSSKKLLAVTLFLFFSITGVSTVYGHGGGLDSQGGHNCYVGSCAGTYHCHQAWGPGCGGGTSVGSSSNPVTPKCVASEAFSLTKRNWAKIQKQLKNAGYSPGAVDGKPGPQTLAALRSYERDFGLDRSSIRNVRASTLESLDAYC
jgi:hypothetical protein